MHLKRQMWRWKSEPSVNDYKLVAPTERRESCRESDQVQKRVLLEFLDATQKRALPRFGTPARPSRAVRCSLPQSPSWLSPRQDKHTAQIRATLPLTVNATMVARAPSSSIITTTAISAPIATTADNVRSASTPVSSLIRRTATAIVLELQVDRIHTITSNSDAAHRHPRSV
jgi:hypothetical protein